ncbi:unnamed protein product [Haemonchus placei]|uniref:Protein kinase domain-containing protein n=1 Tax=Haemonchus placei TaxID=6290 RepID=A0A0N4VUI5_HAEPC|nr:unnamed protein product [Haemonchus placei]
MIPFADGRLDDWLRAHRNLKRDDLLLMVMSAGWGLEYLHQNTILHRDIAAKNCLYDKQFVKLSGFGKIKKTDSYTMKSSRKMAIKWMAPESIESSVFTQKSDVYGYGVSPPLLNHEFCLHCILLFGAWSFRNDRSHFRF